MVAGGGTLAGLGVGLAAVQPGGPQPGQHDPHHDRRRFHQGQGRHHVAIEGDLQHGEEALGRDEGHGADRAVGRSHGGGVVRIEPQAQDQEAAQRHQQRHGDRRGDREQHLGAEAAVGQFHAPLEADGQQQVEREQFGQR